MWLGAVRFFGLGGSIHKFGDVVKEKMDG